MRDPSSSPTLSRRDLLKLGAGAAVMARASGASRPMSARTRGDRPNILLLMTDQHRGDCLGIAGNPAIRTPNLDRIGREGAHFACAYSTTPTCTPARSGLLTGLGPWRHGMLGYGRVGERYPVEKPRALREAGYYTTGIGKMHWCPQRNLHGFHETILDESSREESFDFRSDYRAWFMSEAPGLEYNATGIGWNEYRSAAYVLPERLHPTRWTGDVAVRFLERYARPEPFFLKVSFARPHSPYDPPERFMRMYEDCALPAAALGAWAGRYAERSGAEYDIWHGDLGAEQIRRSRQGYYGSISFIDEQIGRILESLEQRGVLDETLILFISDHGDMTGDHHLWRKSYPYEASAHVPMVMRWPTGLVAAERGRVIRQPVELRDVLPTFLDAAAAPVPDGLDGRSMLPLLRSDAPEWREYIDLEHDVCYHQSNHWNGLTDGRNKYIFHAMDGAEQLFDLETDPGELTDLAGDPAHADELRRWRARLVDHLAERGDAFVRNGQLALRPERMLYSPNYPGNDTPHYRKPK
ncbi:MAG: arylsulfatase [Candidatus Hydrogenedentes bacterium]|nr:arylsulfatase [Candidatus Hydrogenedentota bacterium]